MENCPSKTGSSLKTSIISLLLFQNIDSENFTKLVIIGNERKLFEKYFEDTINSIDYSIYEGKSVIIKGCSDKKIPISAYHILTTKLKPLAKSIMFGEACSAVPVFKKTS